MRTCLVVDDSKVVRTVAQRIVRELDFETRESINGLEALESCRKSMPDVVLLDWNMPVMNGIEFLRELRTSPGGERPKVIFCTTETDAKCIEEAITAGADEYVMKPFDTEIIRGKFAQVGLL
ncbi:MAG: response regulator [Rhodospirillales bacterium]|nr:response regulator [Rhodospirillales bacterium]